MASQGIIHYRNVSTRHAASTSRQLPRGLESQVNVKVHAAEVIARNVRWQCISFHAQHIDPA